MNLQGDLSWTQDRVVEQLVYRDLRRRSNAGIVARAKDPHAELQQEAQLAFNKLCNYASAILMEELDQGSDVVDAIDMVFADESYEQLWEHVTHLQAQIPKRNEHRLETLEDRFPWAANRVISPPRKRIVEKCLRTINAVSAAHHHLNAAGVKHQTSTPREEQRAHPIWFLSDPVLPPDLRRGMLAFHRGSVALIATYPITKNGVPADRFKRIIDLLEFATASLGVYLGVLANMPQAGITIVPADGSRLESSNVDVFVPFREALRRAGESDVDDPA